MGGAAVGGNTPLVIFSAAQKPFVCIQEVPKQTLFSLLTLDMLDIAKIAW